MAARDQNYKKVIAQNKKARFEYFIEEVLEAGIILVGSEVKSLRINGASISESYADFTGSELYLLNANIAEYDKASKFHHHEPKRPRKLILHKRELKKLIGLVQKKGQTLVPLSLYFNNKNLVKIELAVVKGKKLHDKREALKQEDFKRQRAQLFKSKSE